MYVILYLVLVFDYWWWWWMCSAFIQEFRNWDTAWALQALYVIAYEIRVLAERVRPAISLFYFFSIFFPFNKRKE